MADGGEGTVEALAAAAQGELAQCEVTGPLGRAIVAKYGVFASPGQSASRETTAVLDAASIFGFSLVSANERDPYLTTSAGMGELMLRLLDQGIRKFIIGLGGSATNDGGIGLLTSLGARFYNGSGDLLEGYGKDLLEARKVNVEQLDRRLSQCHIVIASDVRNPLCGPQGASVVYGPQKGATPEQVAALDRAMDDYSELLSEATGRNMKSEPGAGAAGGVGYALLTLGAEMASGADVIASAAKLKEKLVGTDWVITGEGKSDNQTLYGKVPVYVARLAKEAGAKAILLSGSLGAETDELEREFAACFSCVPRSMSLSDCMAQAEKNLHFTARNVVRLLVAVKPES